MNTVKIDDKYIITSDGRVFTGQTAELITE